MTNKEAAKILKGFRTYYGMTGRELQAISVAVAALNERDMPARQSGTENIHQTGPTRKPKDTDGFKKKTGMMENKNAERR